MRLSIQGRWLDFLVDTGASGIVIDENVVRQLGLSTYGRYSSGVNAGRYVGGSVLVPSVKIGDLSMTDVAMNTTPHMRESDDEFRGGVKPVGLLGFDLTQHSV